MYGLLMASTSGTKRKLRVAGVQVESRNGEGEGNLRRAEAFVRLAAEQGAQLVLCPEFLAPGYIYHESIWEAAEQQGGLTEAWLREMSTTHDLYIGASYLEVSGDDFFNTFTLIKPDGSLAGCVRKQSLPAFEGWYFKSSADPKVIDTDLGRIGIGICNDNNTAAFMYSMIQARPDLLLMPHSAPGVQNRWFRLVTHATCQTLDSIAPFYARRFGIPTLMVNKAAGRGSHSPLPLLPFVRLRFRFPGMSVICDADGAVLDKLGDEKGIVIADVVLDASRKRKPCDLPRGYWSRAPQHFPHVLGMAMRGLEILGKTAYAANPKRPRAAGIARSR
jgi:N-carbamoylputrescine amidase